MGFAPERFGRELEIVAEALELLLKRFLFSVRAWLNNLQLPGADLKSSISY